MFYIAINRMDAVARVATDPVAKNAELSVEGAASAGAESPVGSAGTGAGTGAVSAGVTRASSAGLMSRVKTSQSNSQKDVVVLNAPGNKMAALPEGLTLSSRNWMDSGSISPSVLSSYATTGFLVSDAGERWKT